MQIVIVYGLGHILVVCVESDKTASIFVFWQNKGTSVEFDRRKSMHQEKSATKYIKYKVHIVKLKDHLNRGV